MGKANRRTGKRESEGRGGTGMGRDIAAVLLTAAGLLAGLALVTFQALDGQLIARGLPPARNLVGPLGHHLAFALFRVLGFAALVLPFALVTAGWKLFRGEARRVTLVASAAYLVLILSVATLCHLGLASRGLASFPAGGAGSSPTATGSAVDVSDSTRVIARCPSERSASFAPAGG